MSVTLTGTGGLFTRLGVIGAALRNLDGIMGAADPTSATWGSGGPDVVSADTAFANLKGQYASADSDLIDGLFSQRESYRSTDQGFRSYLQSLARATLLRMVDAAGFLPTADLGAAWREVIAQMLGNSASVPQPTVSISVAASGSNNGDGVLLATVVGPEGIQRDYVFDETIRVDCTSDSQQGSVAGQEAFLAQGEAAIDNPLAYNWPGGSGANVSLTAADADVAVSNLLTNAFNTWSNNVPSNWTALAGTTAGVDLVRSTTTVYDGETALSFVENDGSTPGVQQVFNSPGGTVATLQPSTVYAFVVWARKSSSSLDDDGKVSIELVDGSGTVLKDNAGNDNEIVLAAAGLGETFAPVGGFFRTPAIMPEEYAIRIRMSEALSDEGEAVFLDRPVLVQAVELYQGGPLAAIISGKDRFYAGDRFTITVSNAYDSAWQLTLERLFGMRALGVQVPSDGTSPTIGDSLL